jgi:hypothetical protein
MSYNLVPNNLKSKSLSKSVYSSIDQSEDFFIFNINLTSHKKKSKKIRKIKNSRNDMLINILDKVNFNKYSKLEISFLNINKPYISHTINIDLNKRPIIYKDDMIYLEIDKELDYMKCFYNLDVSRF